MATYNKQFIATLVILFLGLFQLLAAKQSYNILFIQSYTDEDIWADELNEGLKRGFANKSLSVNITIEYLNSRYWQVTGEEEIMRQICRRGRERGTDLILTSNDEALYSLLTCGDSLPAQVPVIFSGVRFPNYRLLKSLPNITGTITTHAYDKLLGSIKQIFPERKKVIVLTDETTLGQWGMQEFMQEWRHFVSVNSGYSLKQYNVTFDPMTDILADIQLSRDIPKSVVIAPYWGLYMPTISRVSKAPTYTTNGSALMEGVFCVASSTPLQETQEMVNRAVLLLTGTTAKSLGITEMSNQLTYDFKQMESFEVEKDRIPRNGVIINEPHVNKFGLWYVVSFGAILGLLIMFIFRLISLYKREMRKRVRAQTKLLVQERTLAQRVEFDNVFHSIRDAVITYDMDFRIHFVNRAAITMLQLPAPENPEIRPYEGQMTGSLVRLLHYGHSILSDLLTQVAAEGVRAPIPENTTLHCLANNLYFPVSGEVVPLYAKEKQSGMVLSFRNIADEKLQLRYFNLAVTESNIYPWQYDFEQDAFIFSTDYSVKMGFGEINAIPRTTFDQHLHPDDKEKTNLLFESIIEKRSQNAQMIFRQKTASGDYEWWESRASVIGDDDVPIEVIGVCQSIQPYKSIEQELIVARDRATQADILKTAFLANMSHEIRTPLNSIVGFSDLLKDYQDFSEEEVRQYIATINKNCELLMVLINDILDLSRIEAGSIDFQFSPHFLPIIMQEVYESQRMNMPAGVTLVKSIPKESQKTITTDAVRLKQVLNNLINNAAKFTSTGSITFGYSEEPNVVEFFVEDNGIGLTQEEQDHIFERFYKADNFSQGAGLGLCIAKNIVVRLNGTIAVQSQKGKGTRFTVRLPG